jgi:plastocyanin
MRRAWFAMACGGVILISCSNPTGSGTGCGNAAPIVITASDNHTFSPQSATISVGQAVCFQNLGSLLHTITPDSLVPADSFWMHHPGEQALPPNLPTIVSFGTGDFYYHCKYHGGTQTGMWGVVHVR